MCSLVVLSTVTVLCDQSPKLFRPVKLRLYSIRQLQFYLKKKRKEKEGRMEHEEEDQETWNYQVEKVVQSQAEY